MKQLTMKKCLWIITAIYIVVIVPIMFLRFPDVKNEFKYFIITDDMIKSGNYFIMRYFGELYPDKPPLYFWILIFFRRIFHDMFYPLVLIFGTVVPSYIVNVIVFRFLNKVTDIQKAFICSLMLATLPYVIGVSSVIRMDMLMTVFIVTALYIFFTKYYNLVEEKCSCRVYMMYVCMGIGVMVKGGAAVAVPLVTIVTFLLFERNFKYIKNIKLGRGMLIVLSIVAVWFACILMSADGLSYIKLLVGQETVGRMVKSKAHVYPFYYYLQQLPAMLFPYTFFFLGSLIFYLKNVKSYKEFTMLEKISFTWFIGPFIFFSLLSGKLGIYMLPLFPAAVMMTFNFILRIKDSSYFKAILSITTGLLLLVALFGNFALKLSNGILTHTTATILLVTLGVPTVYTFYAMKKKKSFEVVMYSSISIIVGLFIGLMFALPNYAERESLKPIIKYVNTNLSNPTDEVILSEFADGLNISYEVNKNLVNINKDELMKKVEETSEYKSANVITRRKYVSYFEERGYKIIFRNNAYAIMRHE